MRASPPGRPGASALARAADCCARLQTLLMVACLAVMVLLLFGNVALRYLFNSGINVSDELSRLAFVWMIFLGSVLALREHQHIGVTMLVERFGPAARRHARAVPAADAVGAVADGRGQLDPDPDRPGHAPAGHRPAAGGVQRRGAVCGGGHGPADAGGPGPRPGGRPLPAESSAENPLD